MSIFRDIAVGLLGQIFISFHDVFYSQLHTASPYPDLPDDLPLTIKAPYITHLRYDVGEEKDGEEEETILLIILPRLSAPNLERLILGNIMEGRAVMGSAPTVPEAFPKLTTWSSSSLCSGTCTALMPTRGGTLGFRGPHLI